MLNAKMKDRRFHPMAALAASLLVMLSLGTAPAAAESPAELDGARDSAANINALIRVANSLPADAELQQLGQGRLRPALTLEPGEMVEQWVAPGRTRFTVEAADRKLRGGVNAEPGKEYCMILYSRRAPTFRIIRGKLLHWRSNARVFEAPRIRCMQIARRFGN